MNTILYIVGTGGFSGGIERFAFRSAAALRRAGYRVECCFPEPGRDAETFISGFDRTFPLEELRNNAAGCDMAVLHKVPALETLREIERLFGKRLVFWAHDHDSYCPARHRYLPWSRINCQRSFHPLRCALCALPGRTRRGCGTLRELGTLLLEERAKLRMLSAHPAAVLSEFMRTNLLANGFRREQVFVIHPPVGVAERKRPFMPENRVRLLFTGQLIRGKGCDTLLRALRLVEIPFELKIVGDGNDRRRLEKLASASGFGDRISFAGWQTEPERFLEEADLAVLPSRWQEPFGLSGLEAASHGVPVIAFDIGGVGEWLKDGVNGFLIPSGNIEALADGITHAAALRFRLEQMGAAGIELARDAFSEERFKAAMKNLMEYTTR